MKRLYFYVLFSLFGCLGATYLIFFYPVIDSQAGVVYYLKPGTSKKTMIAELSAMNVIKHPNMVSALLYLQTSSQLKSGEYRFPKETSLFNMWYQVTHGKGLVKHVFTIVPGWSFKQLRQALINNPDLQHTIVNMSNAELMFHLGGGQALGHKAAIPTDFTQWVKSKGEQRDSLLLEQSNASLCSIKSIEAVFASLAGNADPEGQFYPDTYYFLKDDADTFILKQAFQLMQKKLNASWQMRATNLPYKDEYDALIAASLIEKEAYRDNERAMIASVLVNRLNRSMLLQFDPTVIYSLGDVYHGKLHHQDLLIDSPYNTYIHRGLPPTPIAIPSKESIDAAVKPLKTDYFYFVARGDGSHQFSKTLTEHNTAVQEEPVVPVKGAGTALIDWMQHKSDMFACSNIRSLHRAQVNHA